MSAVEAIAVARAAGLDLRVDGPNLVLHAPAPQTILEFLSQHTAGAISILCGQDEDRRTAQGRKGRLSPPSGNPTLFSRKRRSSRRPEIRQNPR